jgi:regulator of protease activity HflC (stomatin/prohibitin superfamily)
MLATVKSKMKRLIKNPQFPEKQRHYAWNAVGIVWLLLLSFAGLAAVGPRSLLGSAGPAVGLAAAAPLIYLSATAALPRWEIAIILLIATSAGAVAGLGPSGWRFLLPYALAALFGPSIQIVREWERAIVLRLGKMRKVRGPGLFLLCPLIDTVARKVDLRIRVTDFAAETTLTRDSVPVTVDALCFWLVWDAEKAILEVENYVEAVVLSSQTALREAISSNDLSTLLSDSDKIEEDVRRQVDRKTTEWGITVQHIEITEIIIPEELQKAMSFAAQAEREKKARILLAEAEKQVAAKLQEASRIYGHDPVALRLRSIAVLQEGFRKGNSMVLVPSQLPDELSREDVFGLKALRDVHKAARGAARKGSKK